MNTDAAAPRPMTRQQVHAVVHKIARTYLEVERGLRPPEHLAAFLTQAEYQRHRRHDPTPAGVAGPVRPPDVGRMHVHAPTAEQIGANVLVRQGDDRWAALVVDLRHTGRGWKVERLDRLERLPQAPDGGVPPASDIDHRIEAAEAERRLVAAARQTTSWRIDDIGDRRTKTSRRLRQQLDAWDARLDELDHELQTLERTRALLHDNDLSSTSRGARCPADRSVDDPIEKVLDARPEDPAARQTWDEAADELRAYRDRWNITDTDRPLGAPASAPEEAQARRELVEHLHAAVREIKNGRRDVARGTGIDTGTVDQARGASIER